MHDSPNGSYGTTTIIHRVQSDGSNESWENFVRRYDQVIIEYALSAGLRRDHAEDLKQTVFLELVKLLPTLAIDPQRGSFRSILRTMVKRRSIDFLRRHYRDTKLYENYTAPDKETQDRHWDIAWDSGLLKQALAEVSRSVNPESYQAFELTTLSKVPAKQVSKLLGISMDSVYQRTSRVKSAIEVHYKRLQDEADSNSHTSPRS